MTETNTELPPRAENPKEPEPKTPANQFGKETIVPRKTIVYETRVDPTVIKLAGEKIKQQPFTKFGILKPELEEIKLVSLEKYYQPFIVMNGKYSIDYYRKCTYTVKVDNEVKEVVILNKKFLPEQVTKVSYGTNSQIKFEGEERIVNEAKAFLVLNSQGQDIPPKCLPTAPSEENPQEIIEQNSLQKFDENIDLDFLKQRIAKRPSNISRIISENFEVTERSIIYAPRYKLRYKNSKNAQEKTLEFDGVTSEKIKT